MPKDVWLNVHTKLFWIRDGEPVFLPLTEIVNVDWSQGITLRGIMPHSAILNEIGSGATLELLHSVCGRRDSYYPEDVVVRFTHCRISKKSMPWPMVGHPSEEGAINLRLVLDCDIELREVQ